MIKSIFRISFSLLIVLVSTVAFGHAGTGEIIFAGNKAISSSELRQSLKLDDSLDSLSIITNLSSEIAGVYQSLGYWNCLSKIKLSTDSIGERVISIAIREGETFTYNKIKFDGLRYVPAALLFSQTGSIDGRTASLITLNSYIDNLLEFFAEYGYPFATITAREFNIDSENQEVALTLFVNEGPIVEIDTVIVLGNRVTSDNVIRREIQLPPGSTFKQHRLNSSVARINRLGYITVSDPPQLYFRGEPRQGVLVFQIAENKTSHIDGILGYVPSTGSGKEYLTGMMEIVLDNIMGTGRKAQIYYESTNPKSKELKFAYTEPYLLGTPLDWTLRFDQVDRDSTFIRVSAQMDFSYRLGPGTDLNLSLIAERITPGQSGFAPEERYTGYSTSVGVVGEYFDYPDNPRKGYAFDVSARYIKRIYPTTFNYVPLDPEINRTAGEVRSFIALGLSRNSILFFLGGVAGITGGNQYLPVSERYNIGGRRSVRGYLEGRHYGAIVSFIRSEYRILSGRDGRIFLFSDNGYYYFRDRDGRQADDVLSGFGFGAASKTRLGIVSAEFAWGRGDSFGEGKFHFGIENRF